MILLVGGMYLLSLSDSSSLVMSSVAWVQLSSISLLLLMQTVSSSEISVSARVLEAETMLRRILWEFCCECWKGEYAFIYLKCEIE